MTATFLSGKTIQVLHVTCVILLKTTENYRVWMLIPFCLKLEVCFSRVFCENFSTFFCRWVRGPFLKQVRTAVLRLWVQSITLNSLWLLYEIMPSHSVEEIAKIGTSITINSHWWLFHNMASLSYMCGTALWHTCRPRSKDFRIINKLIITTSIFQAVTTYWVSYDVRVV